MCATTTSDSSEESATCTKCGRPLHEGSGNRCSACVADGRAWITRGLATMISVGGVVLLAAVRIVSRKG